MNPPSSSNDIVEIYKSLIESVSSVVTMMKNGPLTKKQIKSIKEGNSVIIAVIDGITPAITKINNLNRGLEGYDHLGTVKNLYNDFYSLYMEIAGMTDQMEKFKFRRFKRLVKRVIRNVDYITDAFGQIEKRNFKTFVHLQKLRVELMSISGIVNTLAIISAQMEEFGLVNRLKMKIRIKGLAGFVNGVFPLFDEMTEKLPSLIDLIRMKIVMLTMQGVFTQIIEIQSTLDELRGGRFYRRKARAIRGFIGVIESLYSVSGSISVTEIAKLYLKFMGLEAVINSMVRMTVAMTDMPMLIRIKIAKLKANNICEMLIGIRDQLGQISVADAGKLWLTALVMDKVVGKLVKIIRRLTIVGLLGILIAPMELVCLGVVALVMKIIDMITARADSIKKALLPFALLSILAFSVVGLVAGIAATSIYMAKNGISIIEGLGVLTLITFGVIGIAKLLNKIADDEMKQKTDAGLKIMSLISVGLATAITAGIAKAAMEMGAFGPKILLGLVYFAAIFGAVIGIMVILRKMSDIEGGKSPKETLTAKGIELFDLVIAGLAAVTAAGISKTAMELGTFGPKVLLGLLYFATMVGAVVGIMFLMRWIASLEEGKDAKDTMIAKGISLFDLVSTSVTVFISSGIAKTSMELATFGPKVLLGLLYFGAMVAAVIGVMFILRAIAKLEDGADVKSSLTAKGTELFGLVCGAVVVLIASGIAKTSMELATFGPKVLLGLLYLGAMIGAIIGLMFLARRIGKMDGQGNSSEVIAGIKQMGLFTLVLLGVVLIIDAMSLVMIQNYAAVAAGLALSVVVIGAVFLLEKLLLSKANPMNQKNAWKDIARSLLIMSMIALGLVPPVIVMALLGVLVGKHFKFVLLGILGMIVIIGAMALMAAGLWLLGMLLDKQERYIITALLVMIGVSMALIAVALIMLLVSAVAKKIEVLPLLKLFGVILLVIGMTALIGAAIVMAWPVLLAIAAGIGVMLAVFIGLGIVAKRLEKLSKYGQDANFETGAKACIHAITEVTKYIVQEFSSLSIGDMTKLMIKMWELNQIVKFIGKMAQVINNIANLKVLNWNDKGKPRPMHPSDFAAAAENSRLMIRTILSIFFDPYSGQETAEMRMLDNVNNRMKRKMRQLSKITKFIGRMAQTVSEVASLKYAVEWNNNGKPTKFQPMTKEDYVNAALNAGACASVILGIFSDKEGETIQTSTGSVKIKPITAARLEVITNKTKRKMRQLSHITNHIGNMAEVIEKVANMKVATEWNEEGKPIAYRQINHEDFVKFSESVSTMTRVITSAVIDSIKDNDIENIKKKSIKKMNKIMECGFGDLSSMIDTIIKLSTGKYPVLDTDETGHAILGKDGQQQFTYLTTAEINIGAATKQIADILTSFIWNVGGVFRNEKLKNMAKDMKKSIGESMGIEGISDFVSTIVGLAAGKFPVVEVDGKGHAVTDKNGNPVMIYKEFKKDDIDKAINLISIMYKSFVEGLSKLFLTAEGKESGFAEKSKNLGKVLSGTDGLFKAIDKMSKNAQSINDIKNIDTIGDKFKKLADAYLQMVDEFSNEDIEMMKVMTEPLDKFVKATSGLFKVEVTAETSTNIGKSFDSMGKFVVKLNGISDIKLDKMASISKNMADFARSINGNFDKLADALNEKMVTALEKVDRTLAEVNKTMDDLPEKLKSSVSSIKVTGSTGSLAQSYDQKSVDVDKGEVGGKNAKDTKKKDGKTNVTGKTINNCIVQADDGTYAIAVVQKQE